MLWFNVFVGVALLLFGRRLFWLFVAGVGFVVSAVLATEAFGDRSDWLTLMIALGVGLVGAILCVFVQKLIVRIAGFFAGGYVAYSLVLRFNQPTLNWVGFLLGGILGAILVLVLFDWALIILSSLTGATVLAQNFPFDRALAALLFVTFLITGLLVQSSQLRRAVPVPKSDET